MNYSMVRLCFVFEGTKKDYLINPVSRALWFCGASKYLFGADVKCLKLNSLTFYFKLSQTIVCFSCFLFVSEENTKRGEERGKEKRIKEKRKDGKEKKERKRENTSKLA